MHRSRCGICEFRDTIPYQTGTAERGASALWPPHCDPRFYRFVRVGRRSWERWFTTSHVERSAPGHRRTQNRAVVDSSGSAAQFDDREVLAALDVAHRPPEPVSTTTGTMTTRPVGPRLELSSSQRTLPEGFTGSPPGERGMWSVDVVPGRKESQLPAEAIAPVGDQKPSRALALDRSDQPLDDGNAAVHSDPFSASLCG